MAAGDIETFVRDGIWFNRIEGESRTLGAGFETEEEAMRVGRSAATMRQVKHTVLKDAGPSGSGTLYDWHPRDLMN